MEVAFSRNHGGGRMTPVHELDAPYRRPMRFTAVTERLTSDEPASSPHQPEPTIHAVPGPAQRYLRHAIPAGVVPPQRVLLDLSGSVVQAGRRLELTASECLAPPIGFTWRAKGRLGPVTVVIRDHYLAGQSAVDVRLFGLLPVDGERGADTAASSRGRLAAESVWMPGALLPGDGVRWQDVDEQHARVTLRIDGAEETLLLCVDSHGALLEVSMQRWGQAEDGRHARVPYGFRVRAEATFGGITIPSELHGGWWYGTERYDRSSASHFSVHDAAFSPARPVGRPGGDGAPGSPTGDH